LKASADLGVLLQQRYGISINASEAPARAAVSRYEGEEIVTIETQQEQRRAQQIAEARKKFLDGPVLILSLSPEVNYSYDPNNVIGIDASNTVYPTLRLVDPWGVLTRPMEPGWNATQPATSSAPASPRHKTSPLIH
jgi:hypothetical protein